ncbi:MAG: HipA domain-containing protein [Gammaproteobacteria bacterium]
MPDRQSVMWSRIAGEPVKMGSLYVTERNARFQYTPDYVASGLPGFSLLYPPRIYAVHPVVFRQPGMLHPRIQALIPPAGAQNFQRKMLLGILRARGQTPALGIDEDWALLMLAGHGGVGHIDVFPNDDEARSWYADTQPAPLMPVGESLGSTLRDLMTWLDVDTTTLLRTLGPTPTVGGAIPKLLLSIPATGWNGTISTPRKGNDPGRIDIVLKFEPSHAYPGMTEIESLAYTLHAEAGFDVPRHWRCRIGEMPAIAIERFDRDENGLPLPLESCFAILAAGAADINSHIDGSYERIARAIDTPSVQLVGDRRDAKRHLFRRVVMALLTGNGDLHLGNLSIRGWGEEAHFSPVYDPTPMRAYSRHNMLCPIPFGDYGDYNRGGGHIIGLGEALINFAHNLGLQQQTAWQYVSDLLQVTADYPERVDTLEMLPDVHKERLKAIARKMHIALSTTIDS